ncbi:MAG: glycoside hydrolase family 3 N-terminal domain-containing protein [Steroidobacteraceae bacterium]
MSRIDDLLAKMTLPEKLGQLTMTASSYAVTGPVIAGDSTESIPNGTLGNLLNMVGPGPTREMQQLAVEKSRLGIPLLIGLDIIHGHRTLFPIPLAEAAAFDPALWEASAREAAREAAADGLAMTFAPMVDISRDPRWGRTAEGAGEDPWLGSQIAAAKVRGFQGPDLGAADALAACVKHFCAYGAVNAGREYAPVDISERALHEVHLPPFEAAIEAGVATLMPAFTDLDGVPMTAHPLLLGYYLRGRLGFDGVIVSDYNAIGELIKHGVAADLADAAALALNAGVDIDMMADAYRSGLPIALERGTVTMAQIDTAVRRVLTLKERLGLLDDPYRRGAAAEQPEALVQRRALARTLAQRSIVLLKNDADVLPLPATARRLCLIGPLANTKAEMRGPWAAAGDVDGHVTALEGLTAALPQAHITHVEGVGIRDAVPADMHAVFAACDKAETIVLCLGEAANMSGEAASRADPGLPAGQQHLADAVFEHARRHGKPVIVLLFSGRPLIIPGLAEQANALIAAWFLGSEAGNALADVLTGRISPSGRTPMTWPRALGQVPLFFGMRPSGRPADPNDYYTSKYLDVPNEPLYPFGHGLTYGRFRYDNLRVSPARVTRGQSIEVEVDLTNEGRAAAEETVFVFTRDPVASVTRPLLELRGFAKQRLQPGETRSVKIGIAARDLVFPGVDLQPVFEPGEVQVLVGPSADRSLLLRASVQLVRDRA